MKAWNDYYRVLQVHYLAEPEVIESAYKRLSRKYHPDVNKDENSESAMKMLNEAYEILKNPVKRKKYDIEWERKNGIKPDNNCFTGKNEAHEKLAEPAMSVLGRYFANIRSKDFEGAYHLISTNDKNSIPKEDFLKWQNAVSKVFELREFDYRATGYDKNICLNGQMYSHVVELRVSVYEYNTVMERLEKDTFIKKTVKEETGWKVYMGHDGVQPFIERFENLTRLLSAKPVLNELDESNGAKELHAGVLNRKAFMYAAEREVWRQNRYGRIFTLMMCELNVSGIVNGYRKERVSSMAFKWLAGLLICNLRKPDIIGIWGETSFIILLPETDLSGSIETALKVRRLIESEEFSYSNKRYHINLSFGIAVFNRSLELTIEKLLDYTATSKKLGGNCIVSVNGIYNDRRV